MSANWWGATLTVEIAFADGPLVALGSCTWTDVTDDVRSIDINRGRSSELSTYSPGSATLVLDNRSRQYDATNTAGPYYGNLLPMRRVRITAATGVTSKVIYTGYVQGWPIDYPMAGRDSLVALQCVDAMRVLEQSPLQDSAYGSVVVADGADHYWPMQYRDLSLLFIDEIGANDLTVNYLTTYPGTESTSNPPWPIGAATYWASSYCQSRAATTTPRTIELWYQLVADKDATALAEIIFAAGDEDFFSIKPSPEYVEIRYSSGGMEDSAGAGVTVRYSTPPRSGPAHLVVTSDDTTLRVYINGVEVGTNTLVAGSWAYAGFPRSKIHAFESAVAHVATYPTALAAADIAAHYRAGIVAHGHPTGERGGARIGRALDAIDWPSADRDLSTGETVLNEWVPGGASALATCTAVESTEQGLFFVAADGKVTFRDRQWLMTNTRAITAQATFGDQGNELRYQDAVIDGAHIEQVRNLVTVSYGSGSITVRSQTSIDAYGVQSDSVSAELPTWAAFLARQLGRYRLRLRKDPSTRVPSLVVQPRRDLATYLAAIIPLELGDRVNVKRRPAGGTGSFSQDCSVQGINYSITPETMTVSLYLAPAVPSYTEARYLIMGDATRGRLGATSIVFPGTANNYASTPDSIPLDITGDLDVAVLLSSTDWTKLQTVCGKWNQTGNQRSWALRITAGGLLRLVTSADGSTILTHNSTSAVVIDDREYLWVRATIDVNNGAGGRTVRFYTAGYSSTEPTAWSQLGNAVTVAATTSLFNSSAGLEIATDSAGTLNPMGGWVQRLIVRNGIGGTKVFDLDCTTAITSNGQTSLTESINAATVTVNGTAFTMLANGIPY